MTELSSRGPAIGFLEVSSIAKGVEATDAMMKRAAVDLLTTTIVPRGKYLVMVGGAVADVDAAMHAGLEVAGATVVDHFVIQNAHPQLPPAIKGRVKVPSVEFVTVTVPAYQAISSPLPPSMKSLPVPP